MYCWRGDVSLKSLVDERQLLMGPENVEIMRTCSLGSGSGGKNYSAFCTNVYEYLHSNIFQINHIQTDVLLQPVTL